MDISDKLCLGLIARIHWQMAQNISPAFSSDLLLTKA
jgi:hypothetical protein